MLEVKVEPEEFTILRDHLHRAYKQINWALEELDSQSYLLPTELYSTMAEFLGLANDYIEDVWRKLNEYLGEKEKIWRWG